MGFFDRFKRTTPATPEALGVTARPGQVLAPVTGKAIRLEDVSDEVFKCGAMGKGCGIEPTDETVVRPLRPAAARPDEPQEPDRAPSDRRRRLIVVAALVVVLVAGIGAGAAWWRWGRTPPAQPVATAATTAPAPVGTVLANLNGTATPTGLTTSRTAVLDPTTGAVQLTITYSAQDAPLQGPFLEVIPGLTLPTAATAGTAAPTAAVPRSMVRKV